MTKTTYGQYAMDCYLNWFNNYLTIAKFAEHHNMSIELAERLITRGSELYNAKFPGGQA